MNTINLKDQTIANIVTSDFRTAAVFTKYNIDFCCGGKQQLTDVCQKKAIDINAILQDIDNITQTPDSNNNFNNWSLDFLIDYIVNNHHNYIKQNIPIISQYAEKVARVHGNNHAELIEINALFNLVAEDLSAHLLKEEQILFPYIKQLVETKQNNSSYQKPMFGSVKNPIRMMEAEHDVAGDILHKINYISNQYKPPVDACNTYRVLFAKLEEFENDLHKHVHIENNILFPKAIELEESFA